MSEGPRRLRDDPDFAWETGCDLADEAFAVGGYDLPAMKGRLLAEVSPPSVGAPLKAASPLGGWVPVLGAAVALLAVGGVVGAWLAGAPSELPPAVPVVVEAPTPSPVVAVQAPVVAPEAAVPVPAPVEAVAPSPKAVPVAAEPVAAPAVPTVDVAAGGLDEAPEAPQARPTVEPTVDGGTSSGGLAEELALFETASAAALAGDDRAAAEGFEAYRERYPQGSLLDEADLGLLRARVALGDHEGVERLAASLVERPGLEPLRDGLQRTRAENLVWLQRCEEALELVASLPTREGADVRRACRRR